MWNLGRPGGWERYEELSVAAATKIEKVLERNELSTEEVMQKVEAIEDKLKFEAFGKTKSKNEKKRAGKKNKTDEEIVKEQAKYIEEEILKVKDDKKGKVGRVYEMKKRLCGGRKEAQEPVAVRNPDTGELVVATEEIKEVTLKYCEKNLRKDEKKGKGKEVQEELHRLRMEEKDDGEREIVKEDFDLNK